MLDYEYVVVGAMRVNCYFVFCTETMRGIIIDPGARPDIITSTVDKIGMKPEAVVLTHAHFDHSTYADDLRKKYKVPLIIHEMEAGILKDPYMNLSLSFADSPVCAEADVLVKNNDEIIVGNSKLKVIYTPGHTRGGMSLYGDGVLFSGDTLFCGSHGRTDFPTGDDEVLAESIRRLFLLPDETAVNAGHGESTTIGEEKASNYLVKALLERNNGRT